MMPDLPDSLTDNELRAMGIDPSCPFATCPRIPGDPFDVRHGDNRLVRRKDGGFEQHFGYYSDFQRRARYATEKAFAKLLKPIAELEFDDGVLPDAKCEI